VPQELRPQGAEMETRPVATTQGLREVLEYLVSRLPTAVARSRNLSRVDATLLNAVSSVGVAVFTAVRVWSGLAPNVLANLQPSAHDPQLGATDGQSPLLPVYRSLSRRVAHCESVGTEAIAQELCQQRWEDGISGWPGVLYDQQYRGKTKKSIYHLSGGYIVPQTASVRPAAGGSPPALCPSRGAGDT
jgi:hypothetical protein